MQPNEHAVATPIGVRLCEKCSAKIFAPASTGFCSACLLEEGLNLLAGENFDSLGEPAADFGDYELLGEIGRGGQGVVFRARQKSLNRIVALKIIALGTWATETHLKRFRREAEAAARLEHPRIVPIYEIGERDGACYFTMQFVEGGQLDELVRREPLPLRRAAEIVASLAQTVHYAHERGILHRDIKPGNILLDGAGEPHLTDFGLARLIENDSTITRTREVLGTPSFIAPEQASGDGGALTSATDVYGLGAVLYYLLTSHPPFAGGTTYETIRLVLETEPRHPRLWNAKVDRDLATICLKCLEKDPQRRYASALALAEDLERWLGHEPIRARHAGIFYRGRKWIRRNPTRVALLSLGAALLGALGLLFWNREPPPPPAGIAVLPFENLDGDKTNTVFADGIQDDILTRLARIADLKVISRASVMNYRGKTNTREIGDALHVSHLLEGSVRRSGNRARIDIHLIDSRSDQQIWSEEYDRTLDDVYAVQSDIAQQVADELHVKLSPNEKAAIVHPPTKDLQAYDLYVCGAALIETDGSSPEDCIRSIEFLEKAIARDPGFLLAYCKLAKAHDLYYFYADHTAARLAMADSAVQSALRMGPNSGEAHLALASHLYWCYFDYDRARAELEIAGRSLPNDPRTVNLAALIDRRHGHWPEAVRELKRAAELDPRNDTILQQLGTTYSMLREYEKADDVFDRVLRLRPDDEGIRVQRACLDLTSRADVRPVHAVLAEILARNPAAANNLGDAKFWLAIYARDWPAAGRALQSLDPASKLAMGGGANVGLPRSFFEGWVAQMKGDVAAARVSFLSARSTQERNVRADPNSGTALAALAMIDAQLGLTDDGMSEARRATELMPLTKSALEGADVLQCFAFVCLWSGARELAFSQLETLAKIPSGVTYGEVRLDPSWDSLRGDPRFEKIVASLAPQDAENISQSFP